MINPYANVLQPGKQSVIWIKSHLYENHEVTGVLQPTQHIETNEKLIICPSIISSKNNQYKVQINNFQDHPYTIKRATHIANFSILTTEQMIYTQPIDPALIRHLLDSKNDDAVQYDNSLLKTPRSDVSVETYWFPTPQNPGNPSDHTPIQTRILAELYTLEELERTDPQADEKSRDQFLSDFDWIDSHLITKRKHP